MTRDDLSSWLKSSAPVGRRPGKPTRCETCERFSQLDPDIKLWMKRKRLGQIHLPTHSATGGKSLLAYLATKGYNLTGSSLVRHIGLCLGIDHKTGKPH
jgi:hypothetical protein